MSAFRLIVGLGNPGKDYEKTRHNFGFLVTRYLAEKYGLKFRRSIIRKGFIAQDTIGEKKVILFLPLTYMNRSGIAVKAIVQKKNIALEDILVVCDDLNLDFGRLRLRAKGSDGGHNGLHSIRTHLNSKEFARLKLGIGRPKHKKETVDYVLSGFKSQEAKRLNGIIREASDCCLIWLNEDIAKAIDKVNARKIAG